MEEDREEGYDSLLQAVPYHYPPPPPTHTLEATRHILQTRLCSVFPHGEISDGIDTVIEKYKATRLADFSPTQADLYPMLHISLLR